MDKNEIRILNLSEVKKQLFNLESEFPGAAKKIMGKVAGVILKTVRDKTPVDTGNLRRKWAIGNVVSDKDTAMAEIINNTIYAQAVEYGRKKGNKGYTEGKFMLRKGMDEVEKEIPNILNDEMQKYVDKGGK